MTGRRGDEAVMDAVKKLSRTVAVANQEALAGATRSRLSDAIDDLRYAPTG